MQNMGNIGNCRKVKSPQPVLLMGNRRCEAAEFSKKIADITEIEHFNHNEKATLNDLQKELDTFYGEKARGTFIRSRKH